MQSFSNAKDFKVHDSKFYGIQGDATIKENSQYYDNSRTTNNYDLSQGQTIDNSRHTTNYNNTGRGSQNVNSGDGTLNADNRAFDGAPPVGHPISQPASFPNSQTATAGAPPHLAQSPPPQQPGYGYAPYPPQPAYPYYPPAPYYPPQQAYAPPPGPYGPGYPYPPPPNQWYGQPYGPAPPNYPPHGQTPNQAPNGWPPHPPPQDHGYGYPTHPTPAQHGGAYPQHPQSNGHAGTPWGPPNYPAPEPPVRSGGSSRAQTPSQPGQSPPPNRAPPPYTAPRANGTNQGGEGAVGRNPFRTTQTATAGGASARTGGATAGGVTAGPEGVSAGRVTA